VKSAQTSSGEHSTPPIGCLHVKGSCSLGAETTVVEELRKHALPASSLCVGSITSASAALYSSWTACEEEGTYVWW
jgi:hypothetical protein